MDFRGKQFVEWIWSTPLASGATRVIEVGLPNSGVTIYNVHPFLFLTWGLVSSHNCRLEVVGSLRSGGAPALDIIYTQLAVGGVYTTPYLLGGNQGLTGYVVLTRPVVFLQLVETATVDHTYTRFYAKAWG